MVLLKKGSNKTLAFTPHVKPQKFALVQHKKKQNNNDCKTFINKNIYTKQITENTVGSNSRLQGRFADTIANCGHISEAIICTWFAFFSVWVGGVIFLLHYQSNTLLRVFLLSCHTEQLSEQSCTAKTVIYLLLKKVLKLYII